MAGQMSSCEYDGLAVRRFSRRSTDYKSVVQRKLPHALAARLSKRNLLLFETLA